MSGEHAIVQIRSTPEGFVAVLYVIKSIVSEDYPAANVPTSIAGTIHWN